MVKVKKSFVTLPEGLSAINPVEEQSDLLVSYKNNFFSVYRLNKSKLKINQQIIYEIDEDLTDKFGSGLLDQKLTHDKSAKIELRDITKNGYLDIVIGTNDWTD